MKIGGRLCICCFAVLTVPPLIELDREAQLGLCSVECMGKWSSGERYRCFHCQKQVPDPKNVATIIMPVTNQAIWFCDSVCFAACDMKRMMPLIEASK